MATITFTEAQKALNHIQKKQMPQGQQRIPDLLKVKGISSYVYHLKNDLKSTFESQIEEHTDLLKEANDLLPEGLSQKGFTKDEVKELDVDQEDKDRLIEIIERVNEIKQEEQEVKFTKGKIPESDIEEHINALQYEDLQFAIKNGTPPKNEDQ